MTTTHPWKFVVVVIQEVFQQGPGNGDPDHAEDPPGRKGDLRYLFRDVAATKVEQVQEAARQAGHPLQCVSEPVE
jgi:ATP-dependent Clp protease adaptor protein ClpS